MRQLLGNCACPGLAAGCAAPACLLTQMTSAWTSPNTAILRSSSRVRELAPNLTMDAMRAAQPVHIARAVNLIYTADCRKQGAGCARARSASSSGSGNDQTCAHAAGAASTLACPCRCRCRPRGTQRSPIDGPSGRVGVAAGLQRWHPLLGGGRRDAARRDPHDRAYRPTSSSQHARA
jgi:hypothetical protein